MATPAALRILFKEKIERVDDPGFHPQDLERINDDRYLLRVLKHSGYDLPQATDMLFEIFRWRKSVNASEIDEDNIRIKYVEDGIIFPHGRDVDQCLLLIIKCKKHIKGQKNFDEIKRVIIYWFDRIEREENGKKITLLFDLENCGLANMDIDLINYLILLLKSYYPYFLNFIIIYEMPWVMSAAFKLVKSLLPARAIHKLKFVNRETLRDFVNPEQALTCWGGLDNYVFEFIPETKTDNASKKVTFGEHSHNSQHSVGELLLLTPDDTIYFKAESRDISGKLTITNMDESAISFKIRSTASEKFRVRPSSGVLGSGASQTIVVTVQPGYNNRTTAKDRFLILAVQIPDKDVTGMTQKQLNALWQAIPNNTVDEYRLKCHFPEQSNTINPNQEEETVEFKSMYELLQVVEYNQNRLLVVLDHQKNLQHYMIVLTCAVLLFTVITHYLHYSNDLYNIT